MAHGNVYGFDESKCKIQVVDKATQNAKDSAQDTAITNGDITAVTPTVDASNKLKISLTKGSGSKVEGSVELPISTKKLVTSGDISQFISWDTDNTILTISREFDIEYIYISPEHSGYTPATASTTIRKGTYIRQSSNTKMIIGMCPNLTFALSSGSRSCAIYAEHGVEGYTYVHVAYGSSYGKATILYSEDLINTSGKYYRLYA